MCKRVLVVQPIAEEGTKVLKDAGYEVVVPDTDRPESLLSLVRDCDAVLTRTAKIGRDWIESGARLKVIARHGAGFDNIDIEAAAEKGIPVCNVPRANSVSVAEHTVGMILALAHRMFQGDRALRKGRYQARMELTGQELKGKIVGIAGLGAIGRQVARKCAYGLDMQVLGYDPFVKQLPDEYAFVRRVESLETLLSQSDVVSLHVPYNQDLHHMIDEKAISAMKPTSFLVNCARGGLVDEQALYRAIRSGKLAGAALDVFEEEPPPADHPLWELEEVIVTPHMSAHTREALVNMAVGAAEEIVRVLEGKEPLHWVNRHLFG